MDNPSSRPRKESWEDFRPIGNEVEGYARKDSLTGWICLVALLSVATITIVPLLVVLCIHAATGALFLFGRPDGGTFINRDKFTVFGDRSSILVFVYAVGVWWVTRALAEPIYEHYGANPAWLARFGMAFVANAPAVWLMKRRLDKRERAEAAEREAIQQAKRRQGEALLNWSDHDEKKG